jgi:hypothetical protein
MRVVGQGPPCSLLEDPDWGADHFDMGLVCRGDLIPCHQVQGAANSVVDPGPDPQGSASFW